MAKKHKCPEFVNHERWLVSYADFITLLFAFFTVLYAISNTDSGKVEKFVGSAEKAFSMGLFPMGSNSLMLADDGGSSSGSGVYDMGISMKEVEKNLNDSMMAETGEGKVSVKNQEDGVLITLKALSLFKVGSDELHSEAYSTLKKISVQLNKTRNQIKVEGHTDSIPLRPGGRFHSNWDLSTARALAVLKVLLLQGVDPERLSLAGYAEHQPIASNSTRKGRAKNRRVDIFIEGKKKNLEKRGFYFYREDPIGLSKTQNTSGSVNKEKLETDTNLSKEEKLEVINDEFKEFGN